MEINIEIKSTNNNDDSTKNLHTGDYLENIMNEMNCDRMFDEETKLDEERKLHGFPLSSGTTNPKE